MGKMGIPSSEARWVLGELDRHGAANLSDQRLQDTMKWVTREGAKTDRVACPWLIKRFIDHEAEFLFVPRNHVLETTQRVGGKSFDAPAADYTHRGNRCTFEVLLEEFHLEDPALHQLARIVHGADIEEELHTCPESAGLLAIAHGFCVTTPDDQEKLARQFPLYDALYAYCRNLTTRGT